MLEKINDLPNGVLGVRATGKVSKEDYEDAVLPYFDEARQKGDRIRFLYQFGPEFEGFTARAAWEDMRLGMRYLRLFERCAVVSDLQWIRRASRAVGVTMPCPVRVFENDGFQDAVAWLLEPVAPTLSYEILPDRGVVVVEPKGKLRAEDFDAFESDVDAWIEGAGGTLQGIVVRAHEFPGWKDLGTTLRHIRFVRDHHRQVRRLAWAVDSKLASIGPTLAQHFVEADIKRFDADHLKSAVKWASQGEGEKRAES